MTDMTDMTDMTIHASATVEIQAIRPGFFETWRLLRKSYVNPLRHAQELQGAYGNAVMQKFAGITFVHLYGADAHRLALVNDGQVFSNKEAWDQIIGRIFPNGLMLRDGDDHRYHRRLMQAGFKNKAIAALPAGNGTAGAARRSPAGRVDSGQPLLAFPTFKKMTLDLAAVDFPRHGPG